MNLFVLIFIGLACFWLIITYNRLVTIRNHCREAWSNIDTELKRRYELIPNLVETVKGYAAHEQSTLEELTRLRKVCADDHGSVEHQSETEGELVRSLNRVLAVVENYPDLKASEHFLELQRELAITEDRIQAARRFFNGNVRENNNLIEQFPSSIVAGMGGFKRQVFFEVESAQIRNAPPVSL